MSADAKHILRILRAGGRFVQAGVTGTRFAVWRRGMFASGIYPRPVHDELRRTGVLTPTGLLSTASGTAERVRRLLEG